MNLNKKFVRNTELPSIASGITTYTAANAKEDLEFLDKKMDFIKKELTQWDVYKISEVVKTEEEFLSKFNNLLPNTGLIIDSDSFEKNIEDQNLVLSRGDIIYKNTDSSAIYIQSERGGVFYPSQLKMNAGNNNVEISYSFTNLTPTGTADITPSDRTWTVTQPYATLNFKNIGIQTSENIYGNILTSDNTSFPVKKEGENIIKPVIKIFASNNEEIYTDLKWTSDNSNFTCSANWPELLSFAIVK